MIPEHVWSQLDERELQSNNDPQCEEKPVDKIWERWEHLLLEAFSARSRYTFVFVVVSDARRCLLIGTQLRSVGYAFLLQENGERQSILPV